MHRGRATQLLSLAGLDLYRDPTDNAIVAHCGQAYEFFNPGKSSKGINVFRQFKPFRQLRYPKSYRDNPESFMDLKNVVDKFFSMAKTKRALGKELLYNWLVDIVNSVRGPLQTDHSGQRMGST